MRSSWSKWSSAPCESTSWRRSNARRRRTSTPSTNRTTGTSRHGSRGLSRGWSWRSSRSSAGRRSDSSPTRPSCGRANPASPGRPIRNRAAERMQRSPMRLFVNLHSEELLDDELYDPDAPLSRMANRTVLEITERAGLERVPDVRARLGRLRQMGFSVAVDDLGAGYSGLSSFVQLDPQVAKLDIALVRNLHR